MACDSIIRSHLLPMGWLAGAVTAAWLSGWCYAQGNIWRCAVSALFALWCGVMMAGSIMKIGKRVRYIIDATLNGDFSYKFPTENVGRQERGINAMLNRIVERLESLTAEVRQKEAFLTKVINLTDIGMVVADTSGNVRLHNDSALRLLERPALTHVCQFDGESYSGLSIRRSEAMLNGEKIGIYTITDLRRPVQAVEVESWEKLTRVLTHEIMNSLTPVRSIAETMKGKAADTEVREAFDTIASSSGSLMSFVKNFRQFSLLPELQMRAFYLKPLLEKCIRMGEEYARDRSMRFSLMCFPPDVMVYTDEALLSRVIVNILKNAVEALPGVVSVEAAVSADESVEIRITNDGELIAEENVEQIFTPFFTTRPSGSGIGLSLSRRIIAHLGGTLTLRPRPSTCFVIRI